MKRLVIFLLLVVVFLGLWIAQSLYHDAFLQVVSRDFVPQQVALKKSNLDVGLFLACLLAACTVLPYSRSMAPLLCRVRWLIFGAIGIFLLPLLGSTLSLTSCAVGWIDQESWNLAFPRWYCLAFGFEFASQKVNVIAWVLFGLLLVLIRHSSHHSHAKTRT